MTQFVTSFDFLNKKIFDLLTLQKYIKELYLLRYLYDILGLQNAIHQFI